MGAKALAAVQQGDIAILPERCVFIFFFFYRFCLLAVFVAGWWLVWLLGTFVPVNFVCVLILSRRACMYLGCCCPPCYFQIGFGASSLHKL